MGVYIDRTGCEPRAGRFDTSTLASIRTSSTASVCRVASTRPQPCHGQPGPRSRTKGPHRSRARTALASAPDAAQEPTGHVSRRGACRGQGFVGWALPPIRPSVHERLNCGAIPASAVPSSGSDRSRCRPRGRQQVQSAGHLALINRPTPLRDRRLCCRTVMGPLAGRRCGGLAGAVESRPGSPESMLSDAIWTAMAGPQRADCNEQW